VKRPARASSRVTNYLPLDGRVAGAIRLQSVSGSGEEPKVGERDDCVRDVAGVRVWSAAQSPNGILGFSFGPRRHFYRKRVCTV
jgi:hypothetical protein